VGSWRQPSTLPRIERLRKLIPLVALALLLGADVAGAQPAAGLVDAPGDLLVTLDPDAPGTFAGGRLVTGLQPGERIAALAVRLDGALFGIGVDEGASDTVRLYRIDVGSGAATQVGPPTSGLETSASYGAAFAPDGQLRLVNGAGESVRLDPEDGSAEIDPDLSVSDVAAIAYDPMGVLLGLRHATSGLVAIDPASGTVTPLGPLGIASTSASALNFDGAYATALTSTGPAAYRVQPDTGSATLVGALPAALRAFALLPPATVQFAGAEPRVGEAGTATVTVTRSWAQAGSATVAWSATPGTAGAGDFAPASGTLTFAPGQASATFGVTIRPDTLDEDDETVQLALRDPAAPLALGAPASATLTIADDELTPPRPDLRLGRIPRAVRLRMLVRRGIRVAATPNVPVRLTFALLGRTRLAQLSAVENLALTTRTLGRLSAATRAVRLRPPRALVGRPRQAFRVRLQVIATDALGRSRTVNRVVRVRVPAPRRR
jgi:hypothetical protein